MFAPLVLLTALLIATWDTLVKVGARWLHFDEAYSHGFLLLLVSLWLLVREWRRGAPVSGFYPIGLGPLILALLAYIAGGLLLIEAVQQLMVLPILFAGLAVIWGVRQTARFLIPIGVLIFAFPMWDYLAWPLQLITVAVNEVLLGLFSMPFHVDGVFVTLPGIGAFEVAHGCSGLRYLMVGLTMSTLYGQVYYQRWRNRLLLVSIGVLFSLLANWLRVFVIIHQGYVTRMQSPLIEDHDFFGWIVFAATLIPLFWLANRIELTRSGVATNEAGVLPAMPAKVSGRAHVALLWLVPLLLSPLFLQLFGQPSASASSLNFPRWLPENQWLAYFERDAMPWKPLIKGADVIDERNFFSRQDLNEGQLPDQRVAIRIYHYETQKPGKELVQDANRLYDSQRWSLEKSEEATFAGRDWSRLVLKDRVTGEPLHLAFGYLIGGLWRSTALEAKLAQIPAALSGRSDMQLVAIGLSCQRCDSDEVLAGISAPLLVRVMDVTSRRYAR